MQWSDRGTVEEHFGLEVNQTIVGDGPTDAQTLCATP